MKVQMWVHDNVKNIQRKYMVSIPAEYTTREEIDRYLKEERHICGCRYLGYKQNAKGGRYIG